jgi:hypothetical protein
VWRWTLPARRDEGVVIANEAKQSSFGAHQESWIASSQVLLAMTVQEHWRAETESPSRRAEPSRFQHRAYKRTLRPASHSYAAMRMSPRSGILIAKENRAMTKNIMLAASMTMLLVAIPGQVFAHAAGTTEPH